MLAQVCDVLGYLIVVKAISLLSKAIIEPILEQNGYSEKEIERFILATEVIEIAFLLMLLKRTDE